MDRVIGKYYGQERGPMLIVFGAMHGNEPAGVKAIDLMSKMLEVEPITNPDFIYKGMMLGLLGNLKAYKEGKRFIDRDLNRQWTPENVDLALSSPLTELKNEKREIKEILTLIHEEIENYRPSRIVVLDLHTTSSYGGIFSIPTDDEESIKIALELHAPVVKGMLRGIKGTSLHHFNSKNMGVDTTAVVFESGQHKETLSVNRAIAALTNCMRTIGSIDASVVENRHDHILLEYSKNLPKLTRLISRHEILPEDHFKMMPNFNNFQAVKKDEVLAEDVSGKIKAVDDAIILMPLYQEQGEDGFFLVKEEKGF